MALKIERYGVYWVCLDPVRGSEIAKPRPAVVISEEGMNRLLETVVVCPITSRLHPRWPSRVQVRVAKKDAEVAVDQIRTLDKSRLTEYVDSIKPEKAEEIRHVITQMYGVLSTE
jgi:mRNA interferase MazF